MLSPPATEQKLDAYEPLTFEDQNMDQQNEQWENRSGQSINIASTRTTRPGLFGTSASNGSYAMLVRKSTGAIGATKLLKVMAGDRIHTKVDYYFNAANTDNSMADPVGSFVSSLTSSFANTATVAPLLKGEATAVTNQLQSSSVFTNFINPAPSSSGINQAPKAYLCVLFFDERFQFDGVSSRVVPVAYAPGVKNAIDKTFSNALTAGKNGYVYVYFSNESDELVYMDNFMLSHERGALLEETHYYPFGLTMQGISSKAASFGGAENKRGYNGNELQNKEFSDGSGLEMYDFNARTYDQQIGRFIQIDPLFEDGQESLTPYHFSFNNPVRFSDADGKAPTDIIIKGQNNSSVTLQTDLIDVTVNASSLGVNFGGNYTLSGEDVISAGLDIVGILDPTGVADGLNAGLQAKNGDWWGAGISLLGVVPLVGDVAKVGKIGKDVKIIKEAIDGLKVGDKVATTSRVARREAMRDAKIPTSQPLIPDKATKSKDKVFTTRDKNHTVQDAKNDKSHKGKPHWEVGPTKKDPSKSDGLNRSSNNNKPQIGKPKSKVYYYE